jgi:hypothetical protein
MVNLSSDSFNFFFCNVNSLARYEQVYRTSLPVDPEEEALEARKADRP